MSSITLESDRRVVKKGATKANASIGPSHVSPSHVSTSHAGSSPVVPSHAGPLRSTSGAVIARSDRPFRGIALIASSTIFLACSDAIAKYLSQSMPAFEIAWMRFVVFTLILVPVIARTSPNIFQSARPALQCWRGVAMVCSSLFFISGLGFLPIAEASATAFVAPLFVTALSIIFLSEKVGARRWIATIVGLAGVLVIVRPGSAAFHPAAVLPVISALSWAATLIMTRMISGRDRPVTTMAYSACVGLAILSALVPFVWVTPTWTQIALGIGVGIASTAGQWIVVLAFRYADASVLAPFSYTQLIWVTILGFVVFGEVPDIHTIAGAALIIASGLYTAHRERMRRLAQTRSELTPNP